MGTNLNTLTIIDDMIESYNISVDNRDKDKYYDNMPWVEKYRPSDINNIISNIHIVETFKDYVKKKYLPHLLLYGPPGTGKTSIIVSYATELYGKNYKMMVLQINASEERGIEVVRNKIKNFVFAKCTYNEDVEKLFKLVILDEADSMTISAQGILRRLIEDMTKYVRFCFICNKVKNIDPAIQSRCTSFRFMLLKEDDIIIKLREICKKEKIKYNDTGLRNIVKISDGDMRKVLNNLQSVFMTYGEITDNKVNICLGYPLSKDIDRIYNILMKKEYTESSNKITKIIKDNQYLMNDIMTETMNKLVEEYKNTTNISDERFKKIIDKLTNCEYNMYSCINETILIDVFIGCFY
jgi:replication factor C subunit 3/5